MAWIYLAESGGSHWDSKIGFALNTIVSSTLTHKAFCYPECQTEACPSRPFGTMCEHLRANNWKAPSTLSTADSPARTEVLQALASAWVVSEVSFFGKLSDSPKSLVQHLFSSKTRKGKTKATKLKPCEMRLNVLGINAGTVILRPRTSEQITIESAGFYWPTPTARDYRSPGVMKSRLTWKTGMSLSFWYKRTFGANLPATVPEWMMGFPRGHTVLEPWAMQWFRSKRKSRSKDCVA